MGRGDDRKELSVFNERVGFWKISENRILNTFKYNDPFMYKVNFRGRDKIIYVIRIILWCIRPVQTDLV